MTDAALERASRRRRLAGRSLGLALLTAIVAVAAHAAGTFVRVKVETANVRDGPGTNYERLWTVEQDFPLEIIGRKGRWLKTRDFLDSEGWIFAPLTDRQASAVVQVGEANVRAGPSINRPIRFVADWGDTLRVLSRRGEWLQVRHAESGRGWIHRSLVWGP